MLSPEQIIANLRLEKHPEGGWYRETYRHSPPDGGRGVATAIYYLLTAEEYSHWHRVDATEVWHWYAGAPLVLTVSENGHDAQSFHLGQEIHRNQRPQLVVPPNAWQTAETLGIYTLVGCTVSPAFEFEGFELAPPDWRPTPRSTGQ